MQKTVKQKPTGFVATCQCGIIIGALDYERTESREAGKIIGQWLADGCIVEPKFDSVWGAQIGSCKCVTP